MSSFSLQPITTAIHKVAAVARRAAPKIDLSPKSLAAMVASGLVLTSSSAVCLPAHAEAKEKVAEFAASGLIFKDSVVVEAFEDPDVQGVVLYVSDFKRSLSDRLSKDFFTDPSQTSITAVVTGPLTVKDPRKLGDSEGVEIFSEGKGLNIFKNKTVRVRRVFDKERSTLVYVTYSTRLTNASDEGGPSSGRYRTSVSAVYLPPSAVPAPPA